MGLSPKLLRHVLQQMLPALDYSKSPRRVGNKQTASAAEHSLQNPDTVLYDAWLASRAVPANKGGLLTPGAQRPLSRENVALAARIARRSSLGVLSLLWQLYPGRILALVSLDLLRGAFPVVRGYSQALIINEVQAVISSGNFTVCTRLCRLIATELLRAALESGFDAFATANEDVVQSSARFALEYRLMEQRVRMDVPTLADPHTRDLFQESDLFVRSFSGVANFGLFSPLDFLRILTLVSETLSHVFVLWTLTTDRTHLSLLAFSIISYIFPLLISCWRQYPEYADDCQDIKAARANAKQNKMRAMAQSDSYRSEIVLFGLGPWILENWARARKATLGLDQPRSLPVDTAFNIVTSSINATGLLMVLQNVPMLLAMQSSSATLGSFTLYRNSIQAIAFSVRQLAQLSRMAFQSIFLMGAFSAALQVRPRLQPSPEDKLAYPSSGKGMKIEARNISFTYPGSHEPAVRNVSFTLDAGETLAIVGYNGSGKSTLANILLRITGFDGGELRVNGADVRRLDADALHARTAAVFQGFARFDASVRQNVGVGHVADIGAPLAVQRALALGGADAVVAALPHGLKTRLDAAPGAGAGAPLPHFADAPRACQRGRPHGLSGGEWQRIAISRAFMRAQRPEVELLLLDEPTASLDAHAQNRVFETVEELARSETGERTKTVIFITHRLSTARRADKVAMMENGTITEFGTHEELLARGGSYASLYQASV
ncbi:ABC transporter ATP-binding protein [Phanerochaete sordida]|uniref:ABC transporter ATP-binding protein n=1 Tax=Phanerochaete sordida TaxID=48140 RepID=A0A9P3FWI6_9APHY|nr:ABC transporter ATP-binding protein [Phanerochaete sordida]